MIKKFLKFFIIIFVLITIILPITTFIPIGEFDPEPQMEIYLTSNAIHIGIVVPVVNEVTDWKNFIEIGNFSPIAKDLQWIEFGWGDRQFYFEMPTWDHFNLSLAADALFSPDPAVMHVNFLESHPTRYSDMRKVKISYKTYQKMVAAIQSWFVFHNGKPVVIPGKGYTPIDNFYEAKGSFSLFKTCNIWTSDIFAESGLRHPLWSPTKYGLESIWE